MAEPVKSPQSVDEIVATLAPLEATGFDTPPTDIDAPSPSPFDAIGQGIVSRQRALEVLRDPDSFSVFEFDDNRLVLATRRVDDAQRPFVVIVGATQARARDTWKLGWAVRLRVPQDEERSRLAASPALAFATFAERYGADFNAGGRRVRFVPVATYPPGSMTHDGAILVRDVVGVREDAGDIASLWLFGRNDSDGSFSILWPFAVRKTEYAHAER